jgi:hypothetical protein
MISVKKKDSWQKTGFDIHQTDNKSTTGVIFLMEINVLK